MVLNILAGKERDVATKKIFYWRLARLLAERTAVRPADVFVMLQTTHLSDFSFGSGQSLIPD